MRKSYNTQKRTDPALYEDIKKKIKTGADEIYGEEYSSSDDGECVDENDLTIHPIVPDEDVKPFPEPISYPLPGADEKPFVMVALGKRKSGKTTILNNMILKNSTRG